MRMRIDRSIAYPTASVGGTQRTSLDSLLGVGCPLQGCAQVGDCLFRRCAVAGRAHAGTEQGEGAPGAVLILFNHVGDVNDLTHVHSIARRERHAMERSTAYW